MENNNSQPQMDQDVINLAKAIRQKESGGNFDAVGDNGTSRGAYQWQQSTWKGHAKDILGDENAPMTPQNQNAVAYGTLKKWRDSGLNPAQIAAKWNSGSEHNWENKIGYNKKVGVSYNVPQYVKSVTDEYQKIKGSGNSLNKNYSQQIQPVDVSVQREQMVKEGKPVSVNPQKTEPTLAGKAIRGLLGGAGTLLASVLSPFKQALTGNSSVNLGGKYLGDVTDIGTNIERSSTELVNKANRGEISKARAIIGGSLGQPLVEAANLASFIPIGGAASGVAKTAAGEIAPRLLSSATAKSALTNAAIGSGMNLGEQLKSGKKVKVGQVIGSGLLGAGLGTAAEVGLPKLTSSVTEKVAPVLEKLGVKKAKGVVENLNINKAKDEALKYGLENKSESTIKKAVEEGRYTSPSTFSGEKIAPSARELERANEIENMIVNGEFNPKAKPEEQIKQLDKKVTSIDKRLEEQLGSKELSDRKITDNDFFAKMSEREKESSPLFVGSAENQTKYDEIKRKMLEFIGNDKSPLGYFKARKQFDAYMRKENPEIVKRFLSERGNDVRANAYDDIRSVVNELIAESLPPGNAFREQLLREHRLLSVKSKIVGDTVRKSLQGGDSKLVGLLAHPKTKTALKTVGLLGAGAGATELLRNK